MMEMVVWWRRVLLVTVCLTVCHCLESNQMVFSPPSQCWANQSYSSVSLSCSDCHPGAGAARHSGRTPRKILKLFHNAMKLRGYSIPM